MLSGRPGAVLIHVTVHSEFLAVRERGSYYLLLNVKKHISHSLLRSSFPRA